MTAVTTPALSPCPFCGSQPTAKAREGSPGDDRRWLAFVACYCEGYSACAYKSAGAATEADAWALAAQRWNTRAALASTAAPEPTNVPEGWKLVPDSATHNMLNAANAGRKKGRSSSGDIYRTMIAAAPPAPAAIRDGALDVPEDIRAIIGRLHTQDNRITDNPLFGVQQKRRIYGVDENYCSNAEWVFDGETWQPDFEGEEPPDGARKVGYIDTWEFVTGCLTEQGCKDFIRVNGHNLNEPRIYAYGSYRNAEFIALRKWLMSLRAHGIGGTTEGGQ